MSILVYTLLYHLLHVAAVDYDLIRKVAGTNIGPDFGKDAHNPSRDVYQTKADVVKLMQQAVEDGATLIKEQGDEGRIPDYVFATIWELWFYLGTIVFCLSFQRFRRATLPVS